MLAAKLALLEIEREAGTMTAAQVAEQAAAAQVEYDRARALAEIQAETGWEALVGVGAYCTRGGPTPARPRLSVRRTPRACASRSRPRSERRASRA